MEAKMIVDVPNSETLARFSINQLNAAWKAAADVLFNLADAEVAEWDRDYSARQDYVRASQPDLLSTLSNIQQALELGIKSRIAAVSPYLLIAGDVRQWPKGQGSKDISFYEFRTIDAYDLVRVHNAVCSDELKDDFCRIFNEMRRKRNVIVHLGGGGIEVDPKEIFPLILECFGHLFPDRCWAEERYKYQENRPDSKLHGNDFLTMSLFGELRGLTGLIKPSLLRKHYGFDSRKSKYICVPCTEEEASLLGSRARSAQIRTADATGARLYCCICAKENEVHRNPCTVRGCKDALIYTEPFGWKTCVICGERQPESES
ncbi:hypothetical protein [Ferrovibrio sp.]|uniref:hypothetical protein n=1 Tax=Ferrovibrio sp. TaxID=1917215 RepID=UPI00311F2378